MRNQVCERSSSPSYLGGESGSPIGNWSRKERGKRKGKGGTANPHLGRNRNACPAELNQQFEAIRNASRIRSFTPMAQAGGIRGVNSPGKEKKGRKPMDSF